MFDVFFTLLLSVVGLLPLLVLVSAVYLPGQPGFPKVLVPRGEESSFSPRILNPSHQTVVQECATGGYMVSVCRMRRRVYVQPLQEHYKHPAANQQP
jgi:hypothetical protein